MPGTVIGVVYWEDLVGHHIHQKTWVHEVVTFHLLSVDTIRPVTCPYIRYSADL